MVFTVVSLITENAVTLDKTAQCEMRTVSREGQYFIVCTNAHGEGEAPEL
jgi:hypothetical protein